TTEGPPIRGSGGPVNRTSLPDWEESVPNPAQTSNSSQSLNAALMARCRRAISDPVRLENIVERQAAGDSLRSDPQRPRREQGDVAMAETRRTATVVDRRGRFRLVHSLRAARLCAMLETGQCRDVHHALANGRGRARHAANLPESGLRLEKDRRRLGCRERERRRCAEEDQGKTASHARCI